MIDRYKKADKNERSAIIRQIDSLLPVIEGDKKSFWLQFRQKLEQRNEKKCFWREFRWKKKKRRFEALIDSLLFAAKFCLLCFMSGESPRT
jgi:hypothetical protein